MKTGRTLFLVLFLISLLERNSMAVEFEKLPLALSQVLKTKTQVSKRTLQIGGKEVDGYTAVGGKSKKIAFVQKEIYEPNCTHTWVIGVDMKTHKVTDIREVEMSCPHAFPAKKSSFKQQFLGKGPADIPKLKQGIDFIAKATGTCELLRDSVVRSIQASQKYGKPET